MYLSEGNIQPNQLVGNSIRFLEELRKIPNIAKCNSSVLICGETGTGKEICARHVHQLSHRSRHAFVPVNCGAIPVELAENELFGHIQGAFTGADTSHHGLIQEAEGGILFLDEIDTLPALVQVKLLRFLQDRTYRPLGSTKECVADVRVIAAMNSSPQEAVKSARLRQDLYYRLNVISLNLPPLRQRREDIGLLARFFLAKYSAQLQRKSQAFSETAIQKLILYDWPGNVRELQHVVERTIVLCEKSIIRHTDIDLPQNGPTKPVMSFKETKEMLIEQFEKSYIEKLLLAYRGNISKAAKAAQKHRRAFWELIRKYEINVEHFKSKSL